MQTKTMICNNFSGINRSSSVFSESIITASDIQNVELFSTEINSGVGNDLVETFSDSIEAVNSKADDYKSKTKLMIAENAMLPNWLGCISVNNLNSYTVQKSGYLLLILENILGLDVLINNVSIPLNPTVTYLPVKEGDVVTCDIEGIKAYYIPATCIYIENF